MPRAFLIKKKKCCFANNNWSSVERDETEFGVYEDYENTVFPKTKKRKSYEAMTKKIHAEIKLSEEKMVYEDSGSEGGNSCSNLSRSPTPQPYNCPSPVHLLHQPYHPSLNEPSPVILNQPPSYSTCNYTHQVSPALNYGPLLYPGPHALPQVSSSVLNEHSNTGNSRFACSECDKKYSTCGGLRKHEQFHCASIYPRSFTCKHCDKAYQSLGAMKMHIRTHTLPCKCTLCGKSFSRPWLLQGHLRTHTGEKPFACSHCERAFADRSNLRAHLQTHSDVKKYSCSVCAKTFSRMSLLLKHQDGH